MLEILSETKDPLKVQPHLKKCFEAIKKLGFDHDLNIYSMISEEEEEIQFVLQISTTEARGCVEKWLIQKYVDKINREDADLNGRGDEHCVNRTFKSRTTNEGQHTLNTDCEKIGTTNGGLERSKIVQPTGDWTVAEGRPKWIVAE
ncbi:Dynein heavy chain 12, axonemal [Homalodisca vitripennis]|nr:Dynein heavy chain 12, axonemal [Homalodisca vitripennis]